MVILKKIKSSSLIEVLVATVLIVVVFIIASLVLNNLFANVFKNNAHHIENRIHQLEYSITHNQITLPYLEEFGNWEIEIIEVSENKKKDIFIVAKNKETKKEIQNNLIIHD
ncbi:type II secretion system protein [Flavobacterium sp.]|uniref:type II secretion system protein n=1 Tax=Flavobacterium sp. TaxID=239 RepID=UPI0039E3B8A4